jgi:hypothetical protein
MAVKVEDFRLQLAAADALYNELITDKPRAIIPTFNMSDEERNQFEEDFKNNPYIGALSLG